MNCKFSLIAIFILAAFIFGCNKESENSVSPVTLPPNNGNNLNKTTSSQDNEVYDKPIGNDPTPEVIKKMNELRAKYNANVASGNKPRNIKILTEDQLPAGSQIPTTEEVLKQWGGTNRVFHGSNKNTLGKKGNNSIMADDIELNWISWAMPYVFWGPGWEWCKSQSTSSASIDDIFCEALFCADGEPFDYGSQERISWFIAYVSRFYNHVDSIFWQVYGHHGFYNESPYIYEEHYSYADDYN
jgi:hypothetical protein